MKIGFVYNGTESLGIEYISSYLKSKGHKTQLFFDKAVFSSDIFINSKILANFCNADLRIIRSILNSDIDVLGFSVFTGNYKWCLKISNIVKKHKKKIKIVFGGVHVSALPRDVLKNKSVDFVIIGEGEFAFNDLLENINNNKKLSTISNLGLRLKGKIIINLPRDYIKNLDVLPFPDKEMFYNAEPILKQNPYLIGSSRGCPYNCTYCSNNMYKHLYSQEHLHIRQRSPENVVEELVWAKKKFNIKQVYFTDDVFTFNFDWLKKFARLYKRKVNLPYFCLVHPLLIDNEKAKLLKNSGCYLVGMGVQSGSERIRKEIYKRFESNEDIKKAMLCLKDNGLKVQIDHIFGSPTEEEIDLANSLNLYEDINPDILLTFWLTYYPKTEIVEIAKSKGELSNESIKEMREGNVGYTHGSGSVNKNVALCKKYELMFQLIPIIKNDFMREIIWDSLDFIPMKKLLTNIIYTYSGLKYNRKYILNKFKYAFKNILFENRLIK